MIVIIKLNYFVGKDMDYKKKCGIEGCEKDAKHYFEIKCDMLNFYYEIYTCDEHVINDIKVDKLMEKKNDKED